MQRKHLAASLPALLALAAGQILSAASIEDFNTWTEVEDPAHPNLSSSVDSSTQITLSSNGAVPAATDIGYQSVNGADVANSTAGYYFSITNDFSIAVDYDSSAVNSVGLAAIGFGIGEDSAGADSAGIALAILNGSPFALSGGARVNDVTQAPSVLSATPTSSGRFFIDYVASSGDIIFGHSATPGAAAPDVTGAFSGATVQNNWNGNDLLASFFLRSDSLPPIFPTPLSAGTLDAVFSNLQVRSGSATAVVPEPSTLLLTAGMGLLGAGLHRRQQPTPRRAR